MLTLVTHTQGNRPEWLTRCSDSIKNQLRDGVNHYVIQTQDLMPSRWEARWLDEYIAFVDDDDIILPGTVDLILEVLKVSQPGLVFTREATLSPDGKLIEQPHNPIWYSNIAYHPRTAHHLAVMKTSVLDEAWKLYSQFGIGLEWFMKAECALKGGAIHIPTVQYHWSNHLGTMNHSASDEWKQKYDENLMAMGDALIEWLPQDSRVPEHVTAGTVTL